MGTMYEFSKLRNKYRIVFERVLEDCNFYYGYENEISFKDLYDREFKITLDGKKMKIIKDFDNYSSIENIEFPDKYNNYIRSVETIIEKIDNKNKVEVIQRFYDRTNRNNEEYFVVNLFYNIRFNNNISNFECHLLGDDVITEVNHEDISYLYSKINGSRKIEKIFDLYRGENSPLIRLELKDIINGNLNEKCFNYRENVMLKEVDNVSKVKVYEKI